MAIDPAAFAPLILTLKLDASSFTRLDALRQTNFPPERNWLSAHLTLFHHLPGDARPEVLSVLSELRPAGPMPLRFGGVRRLGGGAAVTVEAPALRPLRGGIAARFGDRLTPQDRRPLDPHVTVQNKAPPTVAQALCDRLRAELQPWDGWGEGFLLWRYRGGPWALEADMPWRTAPRGSKQPPPGTDV